MTRFKKQMHRIWKKRNTVPVSAEISEKVPVPMRKKTLPGRPEKRAQKEVIMKRE
jgi:hypothetical protein